MKYNYKGREFNINDDLVQKFNEAFAYTETIDDDHIESYMCFSEYYNEETDNILEVMDRLIAEGTIEEYIERIIKNELFMD